MQYAKVENGQVVSTNLPKVGKLRDGRSVSGYDLLGEEVLKSEGWLPLEENIPTYNNETQYLQHNGYAIEVNRVVSNYIVVDIPIPEPQPYIPTIEEKLEQQVADLNIAMAEIMGVM